MDDNDAGGSDRVYQYSGRIETSDMKFRPTFLFGKTTFIVQHLLSTIMEAIRNMLTLLKPATR